MEMKLTSPHQLHLNFYTTQSLCSLILIISCISGNRSCLVAVDDNGSNDRLALIAFKKEITQDPLGILSSWNNNNKSLHYCEWTGVACGLRHPNRVAKIDLQSQSLVGSISPHIGNLSFLRDLMLGNNSLNGKIPQQIGRLFRLKRLNLSSNYLEGEIPHNISRCSNLMHLNITDNKLVGRIPDELGNLPNLITLRLSDNNLSGEIPYSLGNLSSSLTVLDLGFNFNLEGRIPNSIGQLTRLRFLELGSNKLSGTVPSSLYNISSLELFSLMINQLRGSIPSDIGITLPNLYFFSVFTNNLTGTIPSTLINMSRLEILQLGENNLDGLVPSNIGELKLLKVLFLGENNLGRGKTNDLNFFDSLVNCTYLNKISINSNSFGGVLPSSITNLTTNLQQLNINDNQIYGSIPADIQNLVSLTVLTLADNLFTGSIPLGIKNLKSLRSLDFRKNKLSGSIPSSLGNLTGLFELILYGNKLTGLIPSSLGYCESLQVLDLADNRLSGSIPKQVLKLPALSRILNLANNSLTGSLPAEVGNLKHLGGLYLDRNKLSGEIPGTLGECIGLTSLNLESNFFRGNIPPAFNFLRGLDGLSISHNNLSGSIPKGFETLTLRFLDITYNNLEGLVPTDGVFKNTSAFFFEGNGKLCGGVPDLKLPNCSFSSNPNTTQKPRKSKPNRDKIIIIAVVVFFFIIIVVFVAIYLIKKPQAKRCSSATDVGNQYVGVSYNELLKATNGFNDSTNLLGVESFGCVYKGVLLQYESRDVAVEVINLQQRGASKSFMDECEALRKVRHRNLLKIVTCCSSIDFNGNSFKALVFEFMANGSLENWLHPAEGIVLTVDQLQLNKFNLGTRLSIAADVASALNYLHHDCASPIVHCDLKPSNVLLDDGLVAHVGDFGLAKFLSNSSSNTSRHLSEHEASSIAIKGSIGYISPEYGMGADVSTQGDVYSYGILLLEMFTGKRPTDEMFTDGQNIRNFCKMHELPERVERIIDSPLLFELREGHNNAEIVNYNIWRTTDKMKQILASIIQIGVKCSSELPSDRSSMNEITVEVQAVRNQFLGVRL